MPTKSIYRTPEGEAEINAIYDRQLARLNLPHESRMVNTRFGSTHVLVLGPQAAPPVVMLQGGNKTSPLTLGWMRPLIEKYRVYAPDTIGHPGKSAPVRLSPRDNSYGQWLVEVLDALGLQQPPLLGGSYGTGILLRAVQFMHRNVSARQCCSYHLVLCLFQPSLCCTCFGGWGSIVFVHRQRA